MADIEINGITYTNVKTLAFRDTSTGEFALFIEDDNGGSYIRFPMNGTTPDYGTEGQVLASHGDGSTFWTEAGQGSGLTEDVKQALLACFEKVAWVDDQGQSYYDDLYDALYPPVHATSISLNHNSLSFTALNQSQTLVATVLPADATDQVTWTSSNPSVATVNNGVVTTVAYGNATITATAGSVSATCAVTVAQATLVSISASYTQSGTVYDTDSLDSLKTDLVVTATWSDSSTSTVASTDYSLSGTLAEGTSTITVSYGGKTASFNVTVTHQVTEEVLAFTSCPTGSNLGKKFDGVTFADVATTGEWTVDSTLKVRTLSFAWDATEADKFQISIGQYDSSDSPYKVSNKNQYSSNPMTDGSTMTWKDPAGIVYTAISGGNIQIALPTTGKVRVVVRKSSGTGEASTNARFATWLEGGGLTITAHV